MNDFISLIQNSLNSDTFDKKCFDISVSILNDDKSNYLQLYWASKYLFTFSQDSSFDKIIIEKLELAQESGLLYKSHPDYFLDSAKILAQLYLKYSVYKKANNYFLLLDQLIVEAPPDWIKISYAKTLIHLDLISLINEPKHLFNFLSFSSDKQLSEQEISIIKLFILTVIDNKSKLPLKKSSDIASFLVKLFSIISPHFNLFEEEFESLISTLLIHSDNLDPKQFSPEFFDIIRVLYFKLKTLNDNLKSDLEVLKNTLLEQEKIISDLRNKKTILEQNYKQNITEIQRSLLSTETESDSLDHIKILLIGASQIDNKEIFGIAKKEGISKNNLFLETDYNKIKNFNFDNLRFNSTYDGILIGPIPHKVSGVGDHSSIISKLEKEEGFPPFQVVYTNSGELKITKTSFRDALKKLIIKIKANTP